MKHSSRDRRSPSGLFSLAARHFARVTTIELSPAFHAAALGRFRTQPNVRALCGGTATQVYGLDASRLAAVAAAIDAPTPAELAEPLEAVPAGASPFAFRTVGPWA